ncbi:MAG TPA: hypothetical protein VHB23_12040 [Devosiaceae bacterium]|jgi:hypothetical protein|nr:hypothetical protein [Devosiaceae bacterium]
MQTLPRDVHVGMKVFDRTNQEIGKIEDFKFSENEDNPDVVPADVDATDRDDNGGLVKDIARALAPDDLPEVVRDRMLTEGYIRLDTKGLFAADRYIFPEQIDASSGDALMLNVSKDELMKRH